MTSFGATTPVSSRALNTAFLQLETQIAAASGSPIGSIALWGGDTTAVPAGYLLCDGASYSNATTYAALWNAIGYRYGGSAGNFNVPSFSSAFIPFGTTALNADSSRNAISFATSNFASTGHVHSIAANVGNASVTHSHAQNAVNTNAQSNGHNHAISFNTGNDSVNHYHGYQKPASSPVAAQTGGIDNAHQHLVSGNTGDISLNHSHSTVASNTGDQSVTHSHTVTPVVNATNTDTAHAHNTSGTYVVYIIKYV